jgi:4-hydroxybenzoate polyprenyltransferase
MEAQTAAAPPNSAARTPAKTWVGRIGRFCAARFPLYPNLVVICLQFAVSFFALAKLFVPGAPRAIVPLDFALCGLMVCLFIFLLRTFDEIKDYASDAINFPERPLVSGVLSLRDIRLLWQVTIAILCALAVPFYARPVLWAFALTLVYTLLAFKWFFFEKQISASLPLALVTHNPIVYLWQLLALSFFLAPGEWPALWPVLYLVGDGMTGTSWEIARKIRGTEQEDGYATYSKCWGPRVPVVVVALLLAGASVLIVGALAQKLALARVALFWAPATVVWVLFVAKGVGFFRDTRQAPRFQFLAELFKLCAMVGVVLAMVFPGN